MHLRSIGSLMGLSALLLATSCESGTDPEPQVLIDLALDFCSNDVPIWIAYRNQGEDWTRLTPNADGTVSFTATNDVGLAFVHQNGADVSTEFIFAANTELEAISGQSCREESGSKTLNGSVAGVVGSQLAQVTMNFASAYLGSQQSTFSLTNLPDRPLDLVASRVNVAATTQMSDRVILRRSQSLVNNATMAPIDFAGTEAIVPTSFGVDVTGITSTEVAFLANYFISQLETAHILSYAEPVTDGPQTAVGLPNPDLATGDYHDVFVVAVNDEGAVRGAERYFVAPLNQSLVLGAPMGIPTVETVSTTPYLRLRAETTRGFDYSRAIRAEFIQQNQQFSSTRVAVTVTSGYDNANSWDATIPDLSGASGWQNSWQMQGGGNVDWTVSVFGGRPELLFGAQPGDGELVRFASRSNDAVGTSTAAMRTRATARRPRLFSPSR